MQSILAPDIGSEAPIVDNRQRDDGKVQIVSAVAASSKVHRSSVRDTAV